MSAPATGCAAGHYPSRSSRCEGQGALPLDVAPGGVSQAGRLTAALEPTAAGSALSRTPLALLGIIAEQPSRYGPEQLAASVGEDRVGLAGWIIDPVIGGQADVDEEMAGDGIARLCKRGWSGPRRRGGWRRLTGA